MTKPLRLAILGALRAVVACAVLCLVVCPPVSASAADSLKLTARAFIPNAVPDNPGYVVPIPTAGTGIHSPNPLEPDICFQGDDRDFSTAEGKSARWTASTEVNLFASEIGRAHV